MSNYLGRDDLAPWQHMLIGGLSGGIGPCVNNPLDVVKTRFQKQVRAHARRNDIPLAVVTIRVASEILCRVFFTDLLSLG